MNNSERMKQRTEIDIGIYPETEPDLSIPEHIRKWKRRLKLDCWTGAHRNPDGSYVILLHCDTDDSNIEEVLNHEVIHVIICQILGSVDSHSFNRYWYAEYRHEKEIPQEIHKFLKGLSNSGIGFP